jgi:hypothetical protein
MGSSYNPGRVAGFLYLLLGFSVFRPIFITGRLILRDDAIGTVRNIASHELLFRAGIVSDVLAGISCLVVALALYELLKGVDGKLAVLMVILGGLMPCVLDFLNVLNDIAALLVARGEPFLAMFGKSQQAGLAMLFLRVHEYGFVVNEVFAGLWLLPFGWLVFRSGFLPRILGVGLVINGFAYLAISSTGLLVPNDVDRVTKMVSPALVGEGAIMLWLMIKGREAASDTGGYRICENGSGVTK